jgi:hypothetical protein
MAGFYRIVRVKGGGNESVIRDLPFTDLTDEQQRRAEMFADAETRRSSVHVRVYSSDDNGSVTPDDLIWDSEIN